MMLSVITGSATAALVFAIFACTTFEVSGACGTANTTTRFLARVSDPVAVNLMERYDNAAQRYRDQGNIRAAQSYDRGTNFLAATHPRAARQFRALKAAKLKAAAAPLAPAQAEANLAVGANHETELYPLESKELAEIEKSKEVPPAKPNVAPPAKPNVAPPARPGRK